MVKGIPKTAEFWFYDRIVSTVRDYNRELSFAADSLQTVRFVMNQTRYGGNDRKRKITEPGLTLAAASATQFAGRA